MSERKFCYELSVAIGLEEATIIAQFYFWLENYSKHPTKYSRNFQDGSWWVFNSTRKWHSEQFAFMAKSTFDTKMKKLRDRGYLVKSSTDYNLRFRGKNSTSWYTVDLAKLHGDYPFTMKYYPDLKIPNNASCTENQYSGVPKINTECTENQYTECTENQYNNTLNITLPENIYKKFNLSDSDNKLLGRISDIVTEDSEQKGKDKVIDFFGRYLEEYHSSRNTEHGFVSDRTLRTAVQNVIDSKAYEHTEIIKCYFDAEYRQGCDYRIAHFTNNKILQKRLEAVSKPEQTEQKDSGTWRDSLRYLQRNDIDDLMRFYVPARKEGLDLRKLSDTEYADYIRDDTHGVRLDYSEDREFIGQCLDELLQLIDKPETEDSIIDEPHIKPETHILPEVEDFEWLDDEPEEQLPF